MHKAIPPITMKASLRFFNSVKNMPSGCHEWRGALSRGYGVFWFGSNRYLAHRVSFFIWKKMNPNNLCVLHKCDNRRCVNPEHLFLGTSKDNALGEDSGRAKLTEAQVKKIRLLRAKGHTLIDLADKYGISHVTVWSIVNKRTWRHVE